MIKAYSEMLQDISGNDKEKRDRHLKIISREVDNLTLLISDMLDLSKLETANDELQISEFDLVNLINEIIIRFDYILQKNDINIKLNTFKNEVIVKADRVKISQVIYNLLGNCINFVGVDKIVYIDIKNVNDKVRIEVKDNGKGIKNEDLPHIFERYYKTNDKYRKIGISTGLGLSIVKNILEKHNSQYGVDSIENVGTTFWFNI